MKNFLLSLFLLISLGIKAQNYVTFQVEELTPPKRLLYTRSSDTIFKLLLLDEASLSFHEINSIAENKIISHSSISDRLVYNGQHSFFKGIFDAYANHRPVVLSPDMIWLLISQGFTHHVNNNAEKLRNLFVKHDGKLSLIVQDNRIDIDDPDSPWEKVFPQFTQQIAKHTGADLINALTADFTTTTPATKAASEISIMSTMKPFFEYIVVYIVCGIPEITLEGTTEDWKKVLEKTKCLKKYKLDWWINEVEPILKEFINASEGKVNKRFWRNMFKYHSKKHYGAPTIIDGWLVKFFPYDKEGKRNNLKNISYRDIDLLPSEIVKVDLLHVKANLDGTTINTPLELWAGFVGLQQNDKTFALKPEIGWMVIRKNSVDLLAKQKLINDIHYSRGIEVRVKNNIPDNILRLKYISKLTVHFTDRIQLPSEMEKIKIWELRLNGKISKQEKERIIKLFPTTLLKINEETYNEHIEGINSYGSAVSINELIENINTYKNIDCMKVDCKKEIIIPDEIKALTAKQLTITGEISEQEIGKACKLLPNTILIINGEVYNLK